MIELTAIHEEVLGQTLSEVVGSLKLGVNLNNLDSVVSVVDMLPKEVRFDGPMFGTRRNLLVDCK